MVSMGPRVGGAHVSVNLRFNDRSLDLVGRRIHRQLARIGDQNRRVYRTLGRDSVTAWRAILGAITASAPLIGSAVSGVAGAVTLLGGALYSTVQASYGFAPLLAAIGIAAGTAAIGMNGFVDAVKSGDFSDLTPSAAAAAAAVRSLDDAWQSLRDTVQERMFKGLADDIRELSTTLFPVMERGLGKMADSLNGLAQSLLDYVNSRAGLKQINDLLDNMADIFRRLSRGAVPFLDGLLKLLNALSPAGKRLADRIADIAERFQAWASAPGFAKRIDDMMKRAEKTAGLLLRVLGNLGAAIRNIFDASNPATNTFLEMLVGVTDRFKEWTASVGGQDAIARWAENSVEVMRQFGETLWAVFEVLSRLADHRVITQFLETVEGAFNHLAKLPLEQMVDVFVKVADAIQPVSSALLAFIIAGAAFNILLGTMLGQLGGVFSFMFRISKIGNLFKPLQGAGKHSKALTGISAAFARIVDVLSKPFKRLFKPLESAGKYGKQLSGVSAALGRISRFASRLIKVVPFVGWVVWIGSIIKNSDKLQDKLKTLWGTVKDFGKSFVDAFKEIGEAFGPLMPDFSDLEGVISGIGGAVEWFFGLLDKVGEFALSVAISNLINLFQGMAKVVRGVGKIIAGVVNTIDGLFHWDWDKVEKGLDQILDGVKGVVSGMFQILYGNIVRAGKAGIDLIQKLWEGMKSKFPSILAGVASLGVDILKSLGSLAGRLLGLGIRAIVSLRRGIARASGRAIRAVADLVVNLAVEVARLPGRLLNLGVRSITSLGRGIARASGRAIGAVVGLVVNLVNEAARLPGRLLNLGVRGITSLGRGIARASGRATSAMRNVVTAVVDRVTSLPGDLVSLAEKAVTRLAEALRRGVSEARSIGSEIAGAIIDAISGLPGRAFEIGASIVSNLVAGLRSKLRDVRSIASSIANTIRGALPGSPVEYGPLTAWNYGGGATGGGRNVIDAITDGLKDTSPIRKAMKDVASSLMPLPSPRLAMSTTAAVSSPIPATVSPTPPRNDVPVTFHNHYYGPTTGRDRLREIEWTLRYTPRT